METWKYKLPARKKKKKKFNQFLLAFNMVKDI